MTLRTFTLFATEAQMSEVLDATEADTFVHRAEAILIEEDTWKLTLAIEPLNELLTDTFKAMEPYRATYGNLLSAYLTNITVNFTISLETSKRMEALAKTVAKKGLKKKDVGASNSLSRKGGWSAYRTPAQQHALHRQTIAEHERKKKRGK